MTSRFRADDRGVSIAVTHVLTIGITTVLIAGLLIGAGSLLDSERERGARESLETIGERLSSEMASVDRLAENDTTVKLYVEHPRTVSGSRYTIETATGTDCSSRPLLDDTETCLVLTATGKNVEVAVPVAIDAKVDGSASGGPIEITYEMVGGDHTIRIESDSR